jgi:hypothetical protein
MNQTGVCGTGSRRQADRKALTRARLAGRLEVPDPRGASHVLSVPRGTVPS